MEVDASIYVSISLIFLAAVAFKFHRGANNTSPAKNSLQLPPSPPNRRALPFLGHLHLLSKPVHRSLHNLSHTGSGAVRFPIMWIQFGSRPAVVVSSSAAAEECFTCKNDVALA
ncbi:unnamed protein product [Linum trigynum]|uniref:Cytochrome P450 n=1 Tax=Linum trigynum TaxID=586398 RepID=A0AAV2D3F9_9ROSI